MSMYRIVTQYNIIQYSKVNLFTFIAEVYQKLTIFSINYIK